MESDTEAILIKIRSYFGEKPTMKPRMLKKWLTKLVSRDDPEAMLIMACLPNNTSAKPFPNYQHDLVARAASTGFPPAISHLAELYYDRNDLVTAYQLYEKAAALGESHALKVLAKACELGLDGYEQNMVKANDYAEKAKAVKCWDPFSGYDALSNTFD